MSPRRKLPLQSRSQMRGSLWASLFFVATALLARHFDHSPFLGISIGLAFVSALFALVLFPQFRIHRQRLDAMASGDFIAHWVFSEEQWTEHLRHAEKIRRSDVPKYLVIGLVLGLVLTAAVLLLGVYAEKRPWGEMWPNAAFLGAGMTGICVLGGLIWDLYEWVTLKAWRKCPEVYIGAPGLYIGGQVWPSRYPNPLFCRSRYETMPHPHLLIEYEIRVRNGSYRKDVPVPVPPGRESLARDIVAWAEKAWK